MPCANPFFFSNRMQVLGRKDMEWSSAVEGDTSGAKASLRSRDSFDLALRPMGMRY